MSHRFPLIFLHLFPPHYEAGTSLRSFVFARSSRSSFFLSPAKCHIVCFFHLLLSEVIALILPFVPQTLADFDVLLL